MGNNIPEIWLQFVEEIENFSKGITVNEEKGGINERL